MRVKFSLMKSPTLAPNPRDLNETQHAILGEVAPYKIDRARVSLRENSGASSSGWSVHAEPMIEIGAG